MISKTGVRPMNMNGPEAHAAPRRICSGRGLPRVGRSHTLTLRAGTRSPMAFALSSESRWNWKNLLLLGFLFLLLLQATVVYLTYFTTPVHSAPVNTNTLGKGSLSLFFTADDSREKVALQKLSSRPEIPERRSHSSGTDSRVATSELRQSSDPRLNTTPESVATDSQGTTASHTTSTLATFASVSTPYESFSAPTWKKGSFCDDFIERQFYEPVAVCGPTLLPEHSIGCRHTSKSKYMIQCTLENIAMLGPRIRGENIHYIPLLGEKKCPSPSMSGVKKTTEGNDPIRKIVEKLLPEKPVSSSVCHKWINQTAFVYMGDQPVHIYFRFIALFNLHKAIQNEGVAPGDYVIIRRPYKGGLTYLFPEWEKKLFPELINADDDLPNTTVCFRKVILVAHSFASILFRCKMEGNVRASCFNCKGRGLYGTSLYSFRNRVISSCGLVDSEKHEGKKVTIISRRPYQRWRSDKPENFQRVLTNEDQLVSALRKSFPGTNVTVAHMEGLDICTQIRLAHEADVLMGVHGAGLVHLWWLQEDALMLELNPSFETGNPTFKMLSTLSGRNYRSINVSTGAQRSVSVNVDNVVKELKAHSHLSR